MGGWGSWRGLGGLLGSLGVILREILVSEGGGLVTSWCGFWERSWGPGGFLREVFGSRGGSWCLGGVIGVLGVSWGGNGT